jgi:hypothetical protein
MSIKVLPGSFDHLQPSVTTTSETTVIRKPVRSYLSQWVHPYKPGCSCRHCADIREQGKEFWDSILGPESEER